MEITKAINKWYASEQSEEAWTHKPMTYLREKGALLIRKCQLLAGHSGTHLQYQTWGTKAGILWECYASLIYIVNSRPARATQRETVLRRKGGKSMVFFSLSISLRTTVSNSIHLPANLIICNSWLIFYCVNLSHFHYPFISLCIPSLFLISVYYE